MGDIMDAAAFYHKLVWMFSPENVLWRNYPDEIVIVGPSVWNIVGDSETLHVTDTMRIPWNNVTEEQVMAKLLEIKQWLWDRYFNMSELGASAPEPTLIPSDRIPTYRLLSKWLHRGVGTLLDLRNCNTVKRDFEYPLKYEDDPICSRDNLRYLVRLEGDTKWHDLDKNYMM